MAMVTGAALAAMFGGRPGNRGRVGRSAGWVAVDPVRAAAAVADARRIVVLGTSGVGKSTLAAQLAGRLGVPCVELDALYWAAGWTKAPVEQFRARIVAATAGQGWIVDGNYARARDLVWPRAQVFVWLDYSLATVFARLLRRTLRRWWHREVLWEGNRERLRVQLFHRDSLLLWVLRTHGARRREFARLLVDPALDHVAAVRVRTPHAAERLLTALAAR